jgi:hypothetical protein
MSYYIFYLLCFTLKNYYYYYYYYILNMYKINSNLRSKSRVLNRPILSENNNIIVRGKI